MKASKKLLIASSLLLPPIIATPIILSSCSTSVNYKEINDKINQSLNEIITEESAINLNKLFSSNQRNNVTKEAIAEIIEINEETYVIQQLVENNLYNEYRQNAIESVYESYLEESSTVNLNSRHGNIFSKHFWEAVWHKLKSGLIFVMSKIWWALQIVPTIVAFAGSLDGAVLAEGIASFDHRVPDFFKVLMYDVLTSIKNFKVRTNCTWHFLIWDNDGALIRI